MLDSRLWTRSEIEAHSVDMRQFIGFRQAALPNGMRIIEAYNSSGLTFSLLPDCGLDIWLASYKGLPLTWTSQNAPHAPDMGQSWLRQFNGGLLVTCGLTHVGPPERDDQTDEWRDIHGLYSRLPAEPVSVLPGVWQGDRYSISLTGVVAEARLFGEQLRLTRTVTLYLGEPMIHLQDTVTNIGDQAAPLMILYHCNLGFPLVSEGVRLHTPAVRVLPRDEAAQPGLDRWQDYDAPTSGYAEQVFYHHVAANSEGFAEAALLHEDFGLSFLWQTNTLPYLTQWKNTRRGVYVSGVEPGNCVPEGRNRARQSGLLETLEPGDSRSYDVRLRVLDGVQEVSDTRQRIGDLAQNGTPVQGCRIEDYMRWKNQTT